MNLRIICIGKNKERYWDEAGAEYLKRLRAFCTPQVIELPAKRPPDDPNPAQIQAVLNAEAALILPKLPRRGANTYIAAMCIEGEQLNSLELSGKISSLMVEGVSEMAFVIGGSHGLSDTVKAAADFRFSMSRMTFPHQLARVMLLEQLYRAFMIRSGGRYHK